MVSPERSVSQVTIDGIQTGVGMSIPSCFNCLTSSRQMDACFYKYGSPVQAEGTRVTHRKSPIKLAWDGW